MYFLTKIKKKHNETTAVGRKKYLMIKKWILSLLQHDLESGRTATSAVMQLQSGTVILMWLMQIYEILTQSSPNS